MLAITKNSTSIVRVTLAAIIAIAITLAIGTSAASAAGGRCPLPGGGWFSSPWTNPVCGVLDVSCPQGYVIVYVTATPTQMSLSAIGKLRPLDPEIGHMGMSRDATNDAALTRARAWLPDTM
jgi:hypothetical protein